MKQLSIIILAFVTCWLAGCTVEETNNDNPVNKDGNAHLKVTFSNGMQSRAIGDPFTAELAEKTINRLSFYVYPTKEADKEMVPFQRYVFDMTTMPLTKDSVSIVYVNNSDAGGGYICDFILREGAGFECTIVAIANAPDNFDRTNNLDTYAKLQQAYVDCETMPNTPEADLTGSVRTDKYGLAMYAEDAKMIKKALTTNVVFDMERLTARIDISNAAYEETEANGFVLQSARIINGKHTSYVIPATVEPWTHPGLTTNFDAITSDANPNAFRLATKTGTVSGGNTTDADPSMEDGKVEQRLWHALYTYENDDQEAATATSVEIKGLFRGAPFSRILPFVNYDKKPVVIQRNHRYLVRLNPAASLTDITYNITVAEWNAVDTINVKPTQKDRPTLTYTPSFTPDKDKTLELFKNVVTFTLDAVCQFDTQYKVVPEVGEPAGTDVSWVTVTATEPEVVTRTTGYKRTYTVQTTEMTGVSSRRAMLLIANGANFTARDTLHIKQTIYYPGTTIEPALFKDQYWAPVNCGGTRDLTTVGEITYTTTDVAILGYLYQWGRNVPLKYTGYPSDVADAISVLADFPKYEDACSNTGTYANKFIGGIYAETNFYIWFKDYKPTTTAGLSPALKVGDNAWPRENQPCPAGWRVPTEGELNKIHVEKPHLVYGKWRYYSNYNFCLPGAGERDCDDGHSRFLSAYGYYWSSTLNASGKSPKLYFRDNTSSIDETDLAYGYSVRCVQE